MKSVSAPWLPCKLLSSLIPYYSSSSNQKRLDRCLYCLISHQGSGLCHLTSASTLLLEALSQTSAMITDHHYNNTSGSCGLTGLQTLCLELSLHWKNQENLTAVLDLQMVLAWLARFLKIKSVFKDQNILDKSLYFERCCPVCYSPHSEYMNTWIYPTTLIYVTCLTPYMSSIYSPCPMWIFWSGLCSCQEKEIYTP